MRRRKLLRSMPSGALRSHAHKQGSSRSAYCYLTALHWIGWCIIKMCDKQRGRHFVEIDERDKDRVIMLTTNASLQCKTKAYRQGWG